MWIGIVISVASIVIVAVIVAFAKRRWDAMAPKEWYVVGQYRVGVAYEDNAVKPWNGVLDVITAAEWCDHTEKPLEFWIRVYPSDGDLCVDRVPNATGTTRVERFMGVFSPKIVACVKQKRDSSGMVLDARRSALIHEICEHIWPWVRTRDWNWYCKARLGIWHQETAKVKERYDEQVKSWGSSATG